MKIKIDNHEIELEELLKWIIEEKLNTNFNAYDFFLGMKKAEKAIKKNKRLLEYAEDDYKEYKNYYEAENKKATD